MNKIACTVKNTLERDNVMGARIDNKITGAQQNQKRKYVITSYLNRLRLLFAKYIFIVCFSLKVLLYKTWPVIKKNTQPFLAPPLRV